MTKSPVAAAKTKRPRPPARRARRHQPPPLSSQPGSDAATARPVSRRFDGSLILAELARRHGKVSAEALVSDARSPQHPWHSRFEWNDAEAGHRHRLDQARDLIASVRYRIVQSDRLLACPYYIHDTELASGEQGYVSVPELLTSEGRARNVVTAELEAVAAALRRAVSIAEVLGLRHRIERLTELTIRLLGSIKQPDETPAPKAPARVAGRKRRAA
jgi:hypothetical protein